MALDIPSYLLGKSKGGGSTPTLQSKSVTITENGDTTVTPDTGYDGLEEVNITTNVSGGADLSEYFGNTIPFPDYGVQPALQTIKKIPGPITVTTTNLGDCFYKFASLIQVPQMDTSNVTNMSQMFRDCRALTQVPQMNTSNVTNMNYMFYNCRNLETIGQLDMSNVVGAGNMFGNCNQLLSVPFTSAPKLTDTQQMFASCKKIVSVPQMDTSNVKWAQAMFGGCTLLENIPVLNFSTATNLQNLVQNCPALTNESLNNIMASLITATSYTGTKTLKYIGLTQAQAETCETLSNYQDFINAGWTTGYTS